MAREQTETTREQIHDRQRRIDTCAAPMRFVQTPPALAALRPPHGTSCATRSCTASSGRAAAPVRAGGGGTTTRPAHRATLCIPLAMPPTLAASRRLHRGERECDSACVASVAPRLPAPPVARTSRDRCLHTRTPPSARTAHVAPPKPAAQADAGTSLRGSRAATHELHHQRHATANDITPQLPRRSVSCGGCAAPFAAHFGRGTLAKTRGTSPLSPPVLRSKSAARKRTLRLSLRLATF